MRFTTLLILAVFLATAPGAAPPAHAQSKETLRKLANAYKLIKEDETQKAVKALNAILEEVPEDSEAAAKALLLRGQAYAKSDRHVQALADFNAALWLQGLSSGQRKDAVAGRKAALAKLGIGDGDADDGDTMSNQSERVSAVTEPAGDETADAPSVGAWRTDVQSAPSDDDSDGIGSFLSTLFGGGSEGRQTASVDREPETAGSSGWTATTTDAGETASRSSGDRGQFRVQIASLGTREGAEAEVKRLSRLLGDALQGEQPRIVRTDTDAGNTYFRIVVGPKPSRDDASALCKSIKAGGADCLVVSNR
jgi:cell division protein FtsN